MRLTKLAMVLVAPLILTGCFVSPGKFTSQMKLMSDGEFAYSYDGEIQFLALSKLAEMGAKADSEFEPEDCYDDNFEERACTPAEIDQQREEWRDGAAERMAENAEKAEQLKMMIGGIDPEDPQAAAKFAAKLERQRGWHSVTDKGDGVFDVNFAISGQLSHDFAFPNIEGMPMGSSFVNLYLRDENKVRVEAPGFAAQGAGNPMQGMMGGLMGLAQLGASEEGGDMPRMVMAEGSFTIITDGSILANNTDEGPLPAANGQALSWDITPQTEAAPTALIQF